jgi:hypothetical protein
MRPAAGGWLRLGERRRRARPVVSGGGPLGCRASRPPLTRRRRAPRSNLECLNEKHGHPAANALKQGYREDGAPGAAQGGGGAGPGEWR